ncbi:hypothetical protein [Arsenophonus sp. PmNCSU2021_1]|uniref:hypothetical protein n=1 Tax=Arsenophonus sp. PmNCSU2021_1 TaxID=3118989 RepID=UPI002FEFC12D
MSISIGSGYFHTYISNEKINDILEKNTPPHMSLWEKIKDFFCSTHQAEAQECIYKLCHPPIGTTPDDVENIFKRLSELAHPKWEGNFLNRVKYFEDNSFYIKDKNGDEILSIIIDYDYKVTTGTYRCFYMDGTSYSYPLQSSIDQTVIDGQRKETVLSIY